MWTPIFYFSKLTEKLGNLSRFQLNKNQQNYSIVSVNFKDTKQVDVIQEVSQFSCLLVRPAYSVFCLIYYFIISLFQIKLNTKPQRTDLYLWKYYS